MSTGLVKNVNGIYVGTTAQMNQFRGRNNEIAINTTTKQFRLMDGKTLGGNALGSTATVEHLYDISDVVLDTLTPGQALVWDGNYWVNSTISTTIADGSVTEAKLAANAVTVGKIADGAVTNAKLAGSIALSKLSTTGGTTGQVLRLNGGAFSFSDFTLSNLGGTSISSPSVAQVLIYDNLTSSWKNKSVSGAITITKDGVTSIGNGVVSSDNLAGSIALSKLDTTDATEGAVIKFNGTSWAFGSDANTTSLSGLTDVFIDGTPTNGYVLTYNSAEDYWEPAAPSGGGATALDDLSDVGITDLAMGDFLVFGGEGWHNRKLGYADQYENLVYDTGFALSVGKYYVSEIDVDDFGGDNSPRLYLPNNSTGVSVGDTIWVRINNDLSHLSLDEGATYFDGRYLLSSSGTLDGEGGFLSQANFIFEGVLYQSYIDVEQIDQTLPLEARALYQLTVVGIADNVITYLLTTSDAINALGWSPINGGNNNPDASYFGWGSGDRGFVLQGASKESKAAFYYDDSTNKVYLKGNTAPEGVDYYLEAGNSTASNGGKIRLYGGDSTWGHGGYVRLRGGYANSGAIGGYVELEGGGSSEGEGGYVSITTGCGATNGGYINLQTNYGSNGSGGAITLTTGGSYENGNGGDITLTTGPADWHAGNGGNVTISTGYSTVDGNGGDIIFTPSWGTGDGNRAGNIRLTPAGAHVGASEGSIILQGKTVFENGAVNGGVYSNFTVYEQNLGLATGTTVYLYLNYSSTSVANGETIAIYKTANTGTTRYYVPLNILEIEGSPVIRTRTDISTHSYWGFPDQSYIANYPVASFVMDTQEGYYTYVIKVTCNNDIADTTELKVAFSLSGGMPDPAYTEVLPQNGGYYNQREYEITTNETPITFIGQLGESNSYNQEPVNTVVAQIDKTTKNVYFDSLKAGDSSIVVSTDGFLGVNTNFSLDIPLPATNGEVLTYNESSSKWEAQGGIVNKSLDFTVSGNYRYYLTNNPLVTLPSDGVAGDVFYVQLSPTQTSLTVLVPSPVQRLVALYNQFVYTHPTNMYSGYEPEDPEYWTPSSLFDDPVTITANYSGSNELVIPNFGGLVEFRCYPILNYNLPHPHHEPVWHISVLSGLKSAIYTPVLETEYDGFENIIGKSKHVYRSDFVSPRVYYFIGDDTYPVAINLPPSCEAMAGIEINIKQTGLMDMTISPTEGETIDGEDSFIMSEKGSMATLMCDGTNWFLA